MSDPNSPDAPFLLSPVAPRRARRGTGGTTLSDVARLAGVAPITASRALNSPGLVSPAVLELGAYYVAVGSDSVLIARGSEALAAKYKNSGT